MPTGRLRIVIGRERLERFGPLVDVVFGPPAAVVAPVAGQLLVQPMQLDTGAELTVVEETLPTYLGLRPHRFQRIQGIGGILRCPVYRMTLAIAMTRPDGSSGHLQLMRDVVAMPPAEPSRPHVGLLGRDCMSDLLITYDGAGGELTIEADLDRVTT